MDLFNEVKSSSLQHIIRAVNEINIKKLHYTKNDLINKMHNLKNTTNTTSELQSPIEQDIINVIFRDNPFEPVLETPIPILPTAIEKYWLNELLNEPRTKFLLSPEIREKLQKSINSKNPTQSYWYRKYITDNTEIIGSLTPLLTQIYVALTKQYMIYCESHDEFNQEYKNIYAPYKLEYSFFTDSFYLIMWNSQIQKTVKTQVSMITKLDILDEKIPSRMLDEADSYVKKLGIKTLVLNLKDKYNALERCFSLFAGYDKDVTKLKKDEYQLKIKYYDHFDKEELITFIRSLGSAVTVIAPIDIRNVIIQDLQS